jgi:hypothetical protein
MSLGWNMKSTYDKKASPDMNRKEAALALIVKIISESPIKQVKSSEIK